MSNLGIGVMGQAIGGAMDLGFGMANNQMQQSHIKNVNQQNWKLEQEKARWYQMMDNAQRERFSYDWHRKKMQEAGLSVGLMYSGGAGGTGGQTVATHGGGQNSSQGPGQYQRGANMGIEAMLADAQIKNIQADTDKKVAEADEVRERTPTHSKGMEKTDAEIKEIATRMNVNEETVRKIIQEIEESKTRQTQMEADTKFTDAQRKRLNYLLKYERGKLQAEIHKISTEAATNIIKNQTLNERERVEIELMRTQASKMLMETIATKGELDLKMFEAKLKSEYPGLGSVLGAYMNHVFRTFQGYIGEEGFKHKEP